MDWGSSLLPVAASLALLVGACNRPPAAPSGPDDLVRWWPGDAPRTGGPWSHRELAVLDLPQAPAGGLDLEPRPVGSARRLVVNLTAVGDLYFKGLSFPSGNGAPPEPLRSRFRDCAREAGPLFLLLRVDRLRSWGEVLRLIEWTTHVPDVSVEAVHLAVDIGAAWDIDGRIEARPHERVPRGETWKADFTLDVEQGPQGLAPRLRFADQTWRFTAGDPYVRGPSLDAANAAWLALRDALPLAAHPRGALRVEIDDRVPWAHVAQFLALAQGARASPLEVLTGPWVLPVDVSAPTATPERRGESGRGWHPIAHDSRERDPRDVHPVLLVSIGVLLAALVVLLPLARRPLRRRPPGT